LGKPSGISLQALCKNCVSNPMALSSHLCQQGIKGIVRRRLRHRQMF
jgi:hypothetical protein